MSKKQKTIFVISLSVNALLIVCLVIGYLKISLVHKELFYSEVQYKLVELDGLIEHQKKDDWSEPNLVTTQLGDVLNGLEVATNSGKYSGWLSNDERMTMERLNAALRQYPHDELYRFSVLTQSDKDSFEDLQAYLQNIGFGMNMTISNDWKTFINKSKKLLVLFEYN
ncbi:hypothetical protein F7731_14985 [Cytobacillus depressus]|uniref:Uncharacterized protein n=1 Tax=Cytobacillus depressus TaxID=1602942 RepID=A0A6L3V3A9_9BACI|nr:hypothetical protein [Cytobacillus depressus]KAB2334511.1 hypothetical protein F7731_14985 [Cytobacillus depressus]